MSLSSTKSPPESDTTSKRHRMEYVSLRAFRDQKMSHDSGITDSLQTLEFLVRESSFAGTNVGSKTHLQHPPSFDLRI